jgi:CRP-like cAMP-binding protein
VDDDVVRRSILFASLDEDTARELMARATVLERRRNDVVFRQGDPAEELCILASGRVKLTRAAADQRETVLAVLGPGDVFGETCLLEGIPRAATATAIGDTMLAVLARDDVDRIIAEHADVVPQLMQVLARRLRVANELLSELAFRDVPGRVAKALVDLSERFGEPSRDGIQVAHGLTQEELAQLVGASREAVNKALSDFAGRGWLRLQMRSVVLLNLERLRRRAHLLPLPPVGLPAPQLPGGPVS